MPISSQHHNYKYRKHPFTFYKRCLLCVVLTLVFGVGKSQTQATTLRKNYFIQNYPQSYFGLQCGLQDKRANLWFGSNADGLYVYDGKDFTNFTKNSGLCHNDILCMLEDKNGCIWFGTRGGLLKYQPSGGKPEKKDFTCYLVYENSATDSAITMPHEFYESGNNFVWSILQDRSGKIWLGTNQGVFTFNPSEIGKGPRFKQFLKESNCVNKENLHLKEIQSMVQDSTGNIWFASGYQEGEGLCCYNGKSLVSMKPDGLSSFGAISISKTGALLLLSQAQGLYAYDGKTFTNISVKIGLANKTIVVLKEDSSGRLWLGLAGPDINHTDDAGLACYDGRTLKVYTTKQGLPHNWVLCIVEDKDKTIWIGTRNTGLARFDGKGFTIFSD